MAEHEQYIGSLILINGKDGNTYEGKVYNINPVGKVIFLKDILVNGIPHTSPQMAFNSADMVNLEVLKQKSESNEETECKSVDKNQLDEFTIHKPDHMRKKSGYACNGEGEKQMNKFHPKYQQPISMKPYSNGQPSYYDDQDWDHGRNNNRQYGGRPPKNIEKNSSCFNVPLDNIANEEFDFEKNLALFDKQEFYNTLDSAKKEKLVPARSEKNKNYAPEENILLNSPAKSRPVAVPDACAVEYITDEGLVVPSILPELKRKLLAESELKGVTFERQNEMFGRAATEIILQLLGGGHRLNPKNSHQLPNVVFFCGMNRVGAYGVNCARQLLSHRVRTHLYLGGDPTDFPVRIAHELALYKLTNTEIVNDIEDLPDFKSIDLIVIALADDENDDIDDEIIDWLSEANAPKMALDPPPSGTGNILVKYSLVPTLPLSYATQNGKIYLCNLPIPEKIFASVGIQYESPFGSKFVIPLHVKE